MLNRPAAVLVRLNDSINTGNSGAKKEEYKSCTKCALDTVITSDASKLLEGSSGASITAKENSYSEIWVAVLRKRRVHQNTQLSPTELLQNPSRWLISTSYNSFESAK